MFPVGSFHDSDEGLTAYLMVNPITVGNFAFLFNYMLAGMYLRLYDLSID